jgi:acyl-coenzyme A thioesterase PaaI-like protein
MDGDVTRGWAVYNHAYEGGAGDMHGGAVIAAFDDLLGCAQMVGPVTGRTGTLSVRLLSPSPIAQRIDYVARLDGVEGFKAFCSGEAWCGDTLLAKAEAIFVTPRNRRTNQ